MTRNQKIWFGVSVAMFVVPELLWSPVVNLLYTFYMGGNVPVILRNNFLLNSDYRGILSAVLFLQFAGSVISFFIILNSKYKFFVRSMFSVFLLIMVIIIGLVFYIVFSLRNGISF